VRAGRLTETVAIRRKNQTQAADGSLVEATTTVATVRMHVKALRGDEREQSNQTEAVANYVFTMRYRTDVRADDVLVWNGSDFNIRFIRDEGNRSRWLTIEAEGGVAV